MPIVDSALVGQYAQIHGTKHYGRTAHEFALEVQICLLDLKPQTVLEYGCGRSTLRDSLELGETHWVGYDPAIPELSSLSVARADFIVNTDVLEHVPEPDVDDVLRHIRSLGERVFFNIATRPAREILPDGSNAHCTIWSAEQWLARIRRVFPDSELVHVRPGHSCMLVTWRSPVVGVLARVVEARLAQRSLETPLLKKMERRLRGVRNRLRRS